MGSIGGRGWRRIQPARSSVAWPVPPMTSGQAPVPTVAVRRCRDNAAADGWKGLRRSGAVATGARMGTSGIAAHAHADAMSVEVRHGGVDVLADPGTYCYHGEPAWRSYFRSTIAHNTIELDGWSQSGDGGPFLWLHHANGREIEVVDTGEVAGWTAEHDGYLSLRPPPGIAARSGWTVPRAVSTSSRRSTAVATTSGSPSTSVPTLRRSSTTRARSWAGQAHPRRGRHGWNCRRSCGGACTEVRPIPSSAGTLAAWGSAYPRTHFSAAGNALQAYSSRHG